MEKYKERKPEQNVGSESREKRESFLRNASQLYLGVLISLAKTPEEITIQGELLEKYGSWLVENPKLALDYTTPLDIRWAVNSLKKDTP